MSIVGRRGSSESGWSWSRPPSAPRARSPRQALVFLLAGGGIIAVFAALVLLAVWLSGDGDNSPAAPTSTPMPTVAATPSSIAIMTPSPAPSPTAVSGDGAPLITLAAWDGQRWEASPQPNGPTFGEGEAVPFLLRVERAVPGAGYSLNLRFDCEAFALLTSYDRDAGSAPALAADGPQSVIPDSALSIPHDGGETGPFSLWGGTFAAVSGPPAPSPCAGEQSLRLELLALTHNVYLTWAAEISAGAAGGEAPLRITVEPADAQELSVEIPPESVTPAQS